jgi:hypothetical protein
MWSSAFNLVYVKKLGLSVLARELSILLEKSKRRSELKKIFLLSDIAPPSQRLLTKQEYSILDLQQSNPGRIKMRNLEFARIERNKLGWYEN